MTATAVGAAGVAFAVVIVVIATNIGIVLQRACQKCCHCLVGTSGDTPEPADSCRT